MSAQVLALLEILNGLPSDYYVGLAPDLTPGRVKEW